MSLNIFLEVIELYLVNVYTHIGFKYNFQNLGAHYIYESPADQNLKTSKPFCSKKVAAMDVKSSQVRTILDLPLVIMIAILSRLSIKPIFRCKAVCKLWYDLLSPDPLFVKMYQTRSLNFPYILHLDGQYNPSLLELNYNLPCSRLISHVYSILIQEGRGKEM